MVDETVRWFALQTKTQYERVVARALRGKGFDEFVPLFKRRRARGHAIREMQEPLFPGYVLCRFRPTDRIQVLQTPFVRNVVSCAGRPAPIDDTEVAAVQTIIASECNAAPWPFIRTGDWVRIDYGSMKGVEGVLLEIKKQHRLVVSITLLERSVAVDIDEAWVSPIARRNAVPSSAPHGPGARAAQAAAPAYR